jgi:cAMP-dependent protein kinase regulator
LDSDSFRRLIGPVDDILKRNVARYEKYVKK